MVLFLVGFICIYKYQHIFTHEKWVKSPEKREKLIDDMLNKYELEGMTEREIVALFGEDDCEDSEPRTFKLSKKEFDPSCTLIYYIGTYLVDEQWLIISIEHGIVSDYIMDIS